MKKPYIGLYWEIRTLALLHLKFPHLSGARIIHLEVWLCPSHTALHIIILHSQISNRPMPSWPHQWNVEKWYKCQLPASIYSLCPLKSVLIGQLNLWRKLNTEHLIYFLDNTTAISFNQFMRGKYGKQEVAFTWWNICTWELLCQTHLNTNTVPLTQNSNFVHLTNEGLNSTFFPGQTFLN